MLLWRVWFLSSVTWDRAEKSKSISLELGIICQETYQWYEELNRNSEEKGPFLNVNKIPAATPLRDGLTVFAGVCMYRVAKSAQRSLACTRPNQKYTGYHPPRPCGINILHLEYKLQCYPLLRKILDPPWRPPHCFKYWETCAHNKNTNMTLL